MHQILSRPHPTTRKSVGAVDARLFMMNLWNTKTGGGDPVAGQPTKITS